MNFLNDITVNNNVTAVGTIQSANLTLTGLSTGAYNSMLVENAGVVYKRDLTLSLLPAGTEGQMLYNNAGTWTATGVISWDDTNNRLNLHANGCLIGTDVVLNRSAAYQATLNSDLVVSPIGNGTNNYGIDVTKTLSSARSGEKAAIRATKNYNVIEAVSSSLQQVIRVSGNWNFTSASSAPGYGVLSYLTCTGSGGQTSIYSYYSSGDIAAGFTVPILRQFCANIFTGAGTITDHRGLDILDLNGTTVYGVKIAITAAANKYSIYTGTAASYFGGTTTVEGGANDSLLLRNSSATPAALELVRTDLGNNTISVYNASSTWYFNETISSTTLTSRVATGTAPLTVASTTVVTNLNADLLDGQHGSYYTNYVQSRLENLVTNGNGLLGNNTNFSGWTYDKVEVHGGAGSFKYTGLSTTKTNDEYIPVDPEKYYRLVMWAKAGDTGGNGYDAANRQYVGFIIYDIDQQIIYPYFFLKHSGSTDTTLAQALNTGDTQIVLTDATGWQDGGATYTRQMLWWPYTNAKGYTYADYTYSRNSTITNSYFSANGAWNAKTGNTLTLTQTWPGPNLPAGTPVRNGTSGGTYKYTLLSNVSVPNAWTRYEATIGQIDTGATNSAFLFPYGTAYVRLLFLANYAGPATAIIRYSDITFNEIDQRVPGTAALPAYAFYTDPDTGIFQNGANVLGFSTGGSTRLTVDSTGLTLASGLPIRMSATGSIYDTTNSIVRFSYSTDSVYNTKSTGTHIFQNAGANTVRFDSAGMIKFAGTANTFGTAYLDFSNSASLASASTVYGIIGEVSNSSTGSVVGSLVVARSSVSGTVSSLMGTQSGVRTLAAGTVATNGYAFHAISPTITAGSIGTAMGLRIERQKLASGVTTGYGIYQVDSNDLNYFAGATTFVSQIISSVATGTAPLAIASTTLVTNLNADLLDGQQGSYYLDTSNTSQVKTGYLTTHAITVSGANSGVIVTRRDTQASAWQLYSAAGSLHLYDHVGAADKLVWTTAGVATFTATVAATAFSGPLTGNVTGNCSGSSGSCTGNAATATILQTARLIGGVSFDGSANITLPGVNSTGNQNTTGSAATLTTARTLTIGGTGKTFNGSADVSWTRLEIGVPQCTTTTNVTTENTESCIGYVTNTLFGQSDGAFYSHVYSSSWKHQIQGDYRTGQIALRGKNNGVWQSWRTVLDSSNYNSYAPTLTGTGASGSWGISITGSAASATTATNSTNIGTTLDTSTNATMYLLWVTSNAGGNLPAKVSTALTWNPNTATLTATNMTVSGTLTATVATATNATNSTNIGITDDTATNATMYPVWVTANSGNLPAKVCSTKFAFNPSPGQLTLPVVFLTGSANCGFVVGRRDTGVAAWQFYSSAGSLEVYDHVSTINRFVMTSAGAATFTATVAATAFTGPLTGNVTGNCSGSSGSCTGNAASATYATNVTITDDNASGSTCYPTWVTTTSGNQPSKTSSTKFTFTPSTGLLDCYGISSAGHALTLHAGSYQINATSGITHSGVYTNSVGSVCISLTHTTSNIIQWASYGVAAPTFTTRSNGTKLLLFAGLSGSAVDYALGIESSTLWSSVPTTASSFKWYGGTTVMMTLTNSVLTLGANTVLHAGNYNSYAPTLTGTGASGSWGISITGSAASATNATNISVTDDTATNATMYPVWVTATSGNRPAKVCSTKFAFNPSPGQLTLPVVFLTGSANCGFTIGRRDTGAAAWQFFSSSGSFEIYDHANSATRWTWTTANVWTINAASTVFTGASGITTVDCTVTGRMNLPTTQPASPVNGSCYWDGSTNKFWVYSSTYGWKSVTLT